MYAITSRNYMPIIKNYNPYNWFAIPALPKNLIDSGMKLILVNACTSFWSVSVSNNFETIFCYDYISLRRLHILLPHLRP